MIYLIPEEQRYLSSHRIAVVLQCYRVSKISDRQQALDAMLRTQWLGWIISAMFYPWLRQGLCFS